MFFRFTRRDNTGSKRLSGMLKQLKKLGHAGNKLPETATLIQEIDNAIQRADSNEIRKALEGSGLTSEEMIALLQGTRSCITKESENTFSLLGSVKYVFKHISHKQAMNIPPNFEHDLPEKQAEVILDMMYHAIEQDDGELLSEYARAIGEQFDTPPADLVNFLQELRDTCEDENIDFAARTFLQYLE